MALTSRSDHIIYYSQLALQELLHDILIYQAGPRLRDHLSHGEVNLTDSEMSPIVGDCIWRLAVVLMVKVLDEETKKVNSV